MSDDLYIFGTAPTTVSTPVPPPAPTPPAPPVSSPQSPTAGKISTSQVTFDGKGTYDSGESYCRAVIVSALTDLHLPVTDAWIDGMLTIAERESAYNSPQWQVNTTDSNAIGAIQSDGAPFQSSRGGWQTIPQTFAAYHGAGFSNSIYNPFSNVAAAINYVRANYGVKNDGSNLASKVQQADPNRPPKGY